MKWPYYRMLLMKEAGDGDGGGDPHPATHSRVFTQEQVDDLVTRVRREEKEKLYADVERHKSAAADALKKLEAAESKLKDTDPSSSDSAKLREQIARLTAAQEEAQQKFEKALDNALERQKNDFDNRLRQAELNSFKEKLIAGANGQVIPELVTGATREEIQASFDRAHARYKEIFEAAAAAKAKELEPQLKGALPKPVEPGTPDATAAKLTDIEGGPNAWRKMSAEEWEKKKSEIKRQAYDKAELPMRT